MADEKAVRSCWTSRLQPIQPLHWYCLIRLKLAVWESDQIVLPQLETTGNTEYSRMGSSTSQAGPGSLSFHVLLTPLRADHFRRQPSTKVQRNPGILFSLSTFLVYSNALHLTGALENIGQGNWEGLLQLLQSTTCAFDSLGTTINHGERLWGRDKLTRLQSLSFQSRKYPQM